MEQLELLWILQQKDLAIRELEDKIENNPQSTAVKEAEEQLALMMDSLGQLSDRLKEKRRKQKSMELDLQKISSAVKELQKKMYGGTISNVRELEQMEKKLQYLKKEQADLEERIIQIMEELEKEEELCRDEERQIRDKEQVVREQEKLLEEEISVLQSNRDRLCEQRNEIAAGVENRFMALYTVQCERHRGRGIARVINDNCEGCRVFISAAQRGSLYNPSSIVYCESCGRLLVKMKDIQPTHQELN